MSRHRVHVDIMERNRHFFFLSSLNPPSGDKFSPAGDLLLEDRRRKLCESTPDASITAAGAGWACVPSQVQTTTTPPSPKCGFQWSDAAEPRRDMCYGALNERVVPH